MHLLLDRLEDPYRMISRLQVSGISYYSHIVMGGHRDPPLHHISHIPDKNASFPSAYRDQIIQDLTRIQGPVSNIQYPISLIKYTKIFTIIFAEILFAILLFFRILGKNFQIHVNFCAIIPNTIYELHKPNVKMRFIASPYNLRHPIIHSWCTIH
jgi:hypothetical protein